MMSIFSDMVEDTIEVFMDDLSVVGESFDRCVGHLAEVRVRIAIWCLIGRSVTSWLKKV